jgi:hypothetical protein
MPKRNLALTRDRNACADHSARCAAGVDEEEIGLETLDDPVWQGLAALDRGEFTEVADEELDNYLDDLVVARAN